MLLYTLHWVLAWFWRQYHGGCGFFEMSFQAEHCLCVSWTLGIPSPNRHVLKCLRMPKRHASKMRRGCQVGKTPRWRTSLWGFLAPKVSSFTWPHLSILAEPAHQQVHIQWLQWNYLFFLWWERCPIPTTRWICSTTFSFEQNQPSQLTTPVESPLCASSSWQNDWAPRWQI